MLVNAKSFNDKKDNSYLFIFQFFQFITSSLKRTNHFEFKKTNNLTFNFKQTIDEKKKEIEIAYFGILEEYFGKRLGGFLLSEAIKISFSLDAKRVWLHTSSLDHENALKNYLSRGMTVFKSEILKKEIA